MPPLPPDPLSLSPTTARSGQSPVARARTRHGGVAPSAEELAAACAARPPGCGSNTASSPVLASRQRLKICPSSGPSRTLPPCPSSPPEPRRPSPLSSFPTVAVLGTPGSRIWPSRWRGATDWVDRGRRGRRGTGEKDEADLVVPVVRRDGLGARRSALGGYVGEHGRHRRAREGYGLQREVRS